MYCLPSASAFPNLLTATRLIEQPVDRSSRTTAISDFTCASLSPWRGQVFGSDAGVFRARKAGAEDMALHPQAGGVVTAPALVSLPGCAKWIVASTF